MLPFEPPAEPTADPAVSRETREKIARAFGELPAKLRAAATLALIEQQQYEEIAADLGISVNGVKSRVFRAVRILRKKLKRMGIEPRTSPERSEGSPPQIPLRGFLAFGSE